MGKVTVGAELLGNARTLTEEKMVAFERVVWHRVANVHSNPETAKKVGMSKVIASGQNQLAFLHELMETHFGAGFVTGGKISARWVSPVYANDSITPHGVVKSISEENGRERAELEIWCENQRGQKTAIGTAQAYLA